MTDTRLSEQEIDAALEGSAWYRDWPRDGDAILRDLELGSFADVIALVNRVAAVAEEQNHHPDLLIYGWNRLQLSLSTHSAGGLTAADFALARRIDELL